MHWQGHVGAAAIAYAPLGAWLATTGDQRLAVVGLLVAVSLSTVPDVDQYLPIDHRGVTHTVWFVAAGAIVTGLTGYAGATLVATNASVAGSILGAVAVIALTSHLVADVLTPMGIRPFEPLSSASYTFELVYSKNRRANRMLLAGGGVAVVVLVLLVR